MSVLGVVPRYPLSPQQCWGYKHTALCLNFYVGTGGPNLGPHVPRSRYGFCFVFKLSLLVYVCVHACCGHVCVCARVWVYSWK